MTTINKLSIKGIRSFGIDKDDEQKIEFSSPLTLIVGQNGCGKTTVIECLKYALTGDKPSGTDNGRTFVHDPKVSKVKTALAQVRLTVTNSKMVEKTVVRSMRSEIQKGGKLKFETLDSTICTIDTVKKTRDDVTGRVEDINNNMCQFMGVSKAIINNVIFCHQEDSNWPLDEGKKLKEKFDAIFGTTEYNKAIDKLIKIRKNYQTKLVEAQGNKKYNMEIKDQAETKERDLKYQQDKCTEISIELDDAKVKMTALEKRKDELFKLEQNLSEYITKRNACKATITAKSDDYNNLKVKLKRELSGSIEDLERQLQQFKELQEKKQNQKQKLTKECNEIANDKSKCQESISSCTAKLQTISDQISCMQDLSGERFEKVRDICEKLNIPFNDLDQSVDTQQVDGTFESIKEKIDEEEEGVNFMKIEADEIDRGHQKKIDKLREERTKLETEIDSLKKFIESTEDSRAKIKEEIQVSERSIPALNQLKPKIVQAEKKLEELKNDEKRIQDLKDNQDNLEMDKLEMEDKLSCVDKDIELLHDASKITGELKLKENDLAQNQKEFDRIKNKIMPNLKMLFEGAANDSNYRAKVLQKKESLESETKSLKDQLLTIQRENDRMIDRRLNLRKQIDNKSADLKKIQDNIDDLCKGQEYLNYLASQKEKVAKLNMELAVLRSSKNTYTDYIKKIDENPNCPLCHKGFDHDEGDTVKVELQESIQELPKKINSVEKKLNSEQKIYDKLIGYKSSYDSISNIEKEKSNLEAELKQIEEKIKSNSEKKEVCEVQIVEPESLLQITTSTFMADVYKLDDLLRIVANKKKEVEAIATKVPKNIPKKSLDDVKEERKKLSESIKAKNETMKKNSEEIKTYQEKLNGVHSEINNLNAQKNKFQEKVQGIDRLKEQFKQLESDKIENEQKLKESRSKLGPVQRSLQIAIEEKQKARDQSNKSVSDNQKKLSELKLDLGNIERINRDLIGYQNKNLQNIYEETQKTIKRTKEKYKDLQTKYVNKLEEVEAINLDLANEDTTFRNIQDNIELRKIYKAKKDAQEQLSTLEKSIGDVDLQKFKRDRSNVNSEIEKLNIELGRLSGTLGTLTSSCEAMQKVLDEKKYKEAHKQYMSSVYDVHIYQAAIEDMAKYRIALEKSLLKFHQDKMDQINHLLCEYWNAIYQGNDIDYVMIKTDEESEGKQSTSDKKRSYNYRVVQSKNGVEVDMRGRCSAGQKVLASLVIRMALADTFSTNCGILALDEPTTNLDSANIRSLCNALARIVQERDDDTGKFMLLVITHDQEFANALERADHYWKLSRDNRGCSRIEKMNNY